jgi:hypothetical protein
VLLAFLANRFWGGTGAAAAFLLSVLLWAQTGPEFGFHETPVTLIALFSTASFFAGVAARRSNRPAIAALLAAATGLCGALAFCVKPTALAGYTIALLAMVWPGEGRSVAQRMRLVGVSILGALLPIGIFALLFFRAGALDALLDCYFRFNAGKGGHLLAGLGLLRLMLRGAKSLYVMGLLLLPLTALAVAAVVLIQKRRLNKEHELLRQPHVIFILLWLVLELGGVVINGGHKYHTLPVLPATVLASIWLLWAAFQESTSRRKILAPLALAIIFLPPAARIAFMKPEEAVSKEQFEAWSRIVKDVELNSRPDETIFSLSSEGARLLNSVHRRSATRYLNLVPLMTRGYATDGRWAEMLQEFQPRPPKMILLDREDWTGPANLALMLDWLWHPRFFRVPNNELEPTLFPSRKQFITFVAEHYRLDYCSGNYCLLKRIEAASPGGSGK